jgi:hypothetical protein
VANRRETQSPKNTHDAIERETTKLWDEFFLGDVTATQLFEGGVAAPSFVV